MEPINRFVTQWTPKKLESVPIPPTLVGILSLTGWQLMGLSLFTLIAAFIIYCLAFTVYDLFLRREYRVNFKQDLQNEKIVDSVQHDNLERKEAFCRCWKSDNFPYCDGSHLRHNEATGDNVGPLVINSFGKSYYVATSGPGIGMQPSSAAPNVTNIMGMGMGRQLNKKGKP